MGVYADFGAPLTGREEECLRWAAAGKTAGEIGTITGLSMHTVNQYLATSRLKLGAVNTVQACVLHDRVARSTKRGKIAR